MVQEASIFKKQGRWQNLMMNSQEMQTCFRIMGNFERKSEYWPDSIHEPLLGRNGRRRQGSPNRDVFGYYDVDKGWMCVQVFLSVRENSLSEMSILFPYYNDPDEDLLTYVGQQFFSTEKFSSKSQMRVNTIFTDINEESCNKASVDTKILKPQRGEKAAG